MVFRRLKQDKETLAQKVEEEEEFLTNTLQNKLRKVIAEKDGILSPILSCMRDVGSGIICLVKYFSPFYVAGSSRKDRPRKQVGAGTGIHLQQVSVVPEPLRPPTHG
jgi:hypothetical protein